MALRKEPVILVSYVAAFWILLGCFVNWSYHAYVRFQEKCKADIDNAAANVENVKYQRRIAEAMERVYPPQIGTDAFINRELLDCIDGKWRTDVSECKTPEGRKSYIGNCDCWGTVWPIVPAKQQK